MISHGVCLTCQEPDKPTLLVQVNTDTWGDDLDPPEPMCRTCVNGYKQAGITVVLIAGHTPKETPAHHLRNALQIIQCHRDTGGLKSLDSIEARIKKALVLIEQETK